MIKLFKILKIINFTKQGDLVIEYAGSKIRLTKNGDIIINAKRHTIHHRDLFFDGCESEFIEEAIKQNSKGKKQLEKYVMSSNRATEFTCNSNSKKENIKEIVNGNGD